MLRSKVWHKSSRCESSACVEVALLEDGVAVRSTEHPESVMTVGPKVWTEFIAAIRNGDIRPS